MVHLRSEGVAAEEADVLGRRDIRHPRARGWLVDGVSPLSAHHAHTTKAGVEDLPWGFLREPVR